MASTIHVDIVSAESAIHSGLATMVYAPGEMGELGIAPRQVFLPEVIIEVQVEERAIHVQQHGFDLPPVDHAESQGSRTTRNPTL